MLGYAAPANAPSTPSPWKP